MNLFYSVLKDNTELQGLLGALRARRLPALVQGLPIVARAHMTAAVCSAENRTALVITHDEAGANRMTRDLVTMGLRVCLYPVRDRNFHTDESRSGEYERMRIGALSRICSGECDVVVASVAAAVQYTMPVEVLKRRSVLLTEGAEVPREKLLEVLAGADYSFAELVEGPGQYCARGSIVDFFPPGAERPVRVEYWGDEIESMSEFDVVSQRRDTKLERVEIIPASEIAADDRSELADRIEELASSLDAKKSAAVRESMYRDAESLRGGVPVPSLERYFGLIYDTKETLFDYCSDRLLIVCESSIVSESLDSALKLSEERVKLMIEEGVLCRELADLSLTAKGFGDVCAKSDTLYFNDFVETEFDVPVKEVFNMNVRQGTSWEGTVASLKEELIGICERGYTVLMFAGTERSVFTALTDLGDMGIKALVADTAVEAEKGRVYVLPGALSHGIEYPRDKLAVLTYGRYRAAHDAAVNRKRRARRRNDENSIHSLDDLHEGEYVVHAFYGIGRFECLTTKEVLGFTKDYIKLEYHKGTHLFVPVEQLDKLSKYVTAGGDDAKPVKLSRLDTNDWSRTKSRVKRAVRDIAEELIRLYSVRENTDGFPFSQDIDIQKDFEDRFEYDETEDQIRCAAEIKADMESTHPMDRLLCGDVGVGKTEVALRAAFKCVCDGKQVAILVPTTILAYQHYRTLTQRFEGFPVNIDMLSRFRSPTQCREINKKLEKGQIDIIVGTHKLLGKGVKFKDLGLIIVDEEQRFGVSQKEKLKEAHPAVDVLSMSATPIPRTLNMSMMGVRDLSVINEAPVDRKPVQTYVLKQDMNVLADAMRMELRRGGQVYYLHNKVEDIDRCAEEIRRLIPEAAVDVGHGKMNETELSRVWQRLLNGDTDILVCTTIIETGVDVPNVNTLIIENADKMGLAQLHQIRGRVGRSSRRGYAYLTYRDSAMSDDARRRLTAIRDFTEFGSGFKIAMRDMEIRGAGTLLGAEQSGHLEAVGYETYLEILAESIDELKNGTLSDEKKEKPNCQVNILTDSHIPEKYISTVGQRLAAYRHIAAIENSESEAAVREELADRYGRLPRSVESLLAVARAKNSAARRGVYEISQYSDQVEFKFKKLNSFVGAIFLEAFPGQTEVRLTGDKPYIRIKMKKGVSPVDILRKATTLFELDSAALDLLTAEDPQNT